MDPAGHYQRAMTGGGVRGRRGGHNPGPVGPWSFSRRRESTSAKRCFSKHKPVEMELDNPGGGAAGRAEFHLGRGSFIEHKPVEMELDNPRGARLGGPSSTSALRRFSEHKPVEMELDNPRGRIWEGRVPPRPGGVSACTNPSRWNSMRWSPPSPLYGVDAPGDRC